MLRCSRAVKRARRTAYRQKAFLSRRRKPEAPLEVQENNDFAVPESWAVAMNLYRVTQAFRERGHFVAETDPLEKHISKLAEEGIELRNFHRDSFESFLFYEKNCVETHQQSALSELARNSADPNRRNNRFVSMGFGTHEKGPASAERVMRKTFECKRCLNRGTKYVSICSTNTSLFQPH